MLRRRLIKFFAVGLLAVSLTAVSASRASAAPAYSQNVGGGSCWYPNPNGGLGVFYPKIQHPGDGWYSTWNSNVIQKRWLIVIDAGTGWQVPNSDYHFYQRTIGPYASGTFGAEWLYLPRLSTPMRIQSITQYLTVSGVVLETDFVTATSYTKYTKNEYSGFSADLLTYGSCKG